MQLGVLVSGSLGNSVLKYLDTIYPIIFVMTDKKSTSIINFCTDNKIKVFVGNPRKGRCRDFIKNLDIDVLISINYLFIIEKELISLPKRLAFNIHGSLLPKYRGRTPHVWAIINNEHETGITAHLIDEGCDTGDIIEQIVIRIGENDTGADILSKFTENYIPLVKTVLDKISSESIVLRKQEHNKASFFGRRTPEDGRINWNWHKERINNWVRAQADPYPGAYTYINDQKITIDKIQYSDFGFNYDMQNGLILQTKPNILVKTSNGVIKLVTIREQENIQFSKNTQLK